MAVWVGVQEFQDALPSSLCLRGVPVFVANGGQVRFGFQDGDVEAGDQEAGVGAAVVLAFRVPGDR